MERLRRERLVLPPVAALGLLPRPEILVDDFPAAAFVGGEDGVAPTLGGRDLALQLAVALQSLGTERSRVEGRLYRATGLTLVQTVVEPAGEGDLDDVGEGRVDATAVFQQSQLAHAGGVDEHPATR